MKDEQDRLLLAISFVWDTREDADEFFQSYLDLVQVKSQGKWELVHRNENERSWVGEDISIHLSLDGDGTLVVIGPDMETVESAVKEISGFDAQGVAES